MTGFFSFQMREDGDVTWVLYANNYREITRAKRYYNCLDHARNAARRFQRIVSDARVQYRVGKKKPKGSFRNI